MGIEDLKRCAGILGKSARGEVNCQSHFDLKGTRMPEGPELFEMIDHYINDLFAPADDAMAFSLREARTSGLPEIQVTPGQGKFIYLLAKIVGARRILEVGTLGGYSTIWLARALPEDGRLITLEIDGAHARVAASSIARAGMSSKVEIIVGSAIQTLPTVCEKADAPFDLVFIDADKVNYPTYLGHIMKSVRSGSLILADNVIRKGAVLAPRPDDPNAEGARAFNVLIAADERLEAIILQQVGVKGHDGLAIARVK
jgi:predicted O-methyltransferase YrrM